MTDAGTGRPTRTSTVIALAVTLATVGALVWQVELVAVPTVLGAVGAAWLAASLWLVDRDGREATTALVASILVVPVGAGVLAATTVTVLLAMGAVFPVAERTLISVGILVVVGYAGVTTGCVLAVLGLALGVRDVVTTAGLAAYTRVSVFAGTVPAVVAAVLVLLPVVFGDAGTTLSGTGVSTVVGPLLSPTPPQLHLATFALAVVLAAGGLRVALSVLPVVELLADSGLGETSERRVSRAGRVLSGMAVVAGMATVAGSLLELQFSPTELAAALGPAYRAIQGVTTAGGLRVILVGTASLAFAASAVSVVARRIARQPGETRGERITPFVGGGLVTVFVLGVADPVYRRGTARTAEVLPGVVGDEFRLVATELADVFGEGALLVLLATILAGVPLTVVLALRGLRRLGYLSAATAGYAMASTGMFVATVFAGTLDAPVPLVFGGVVASIAVWDMGQFGTTLGREVRHTAGTRSVELVHAGGTVLVGIVGVGAALGVGWVLPGTGGAETPAAVTALLAVVTGILLLVAALR